MNHNNINKTKNIIYFLSYCGLLPFVITLLVSILGSKELNSYSIIMFVSYGAVILGFIGAVHWGFLLESKPIKGKGLLLSISVLPSLIGWFALIIPTPVALLILCITYPLLFIYERYSTLNILLPGWYMLMRLKLTIIVTILIFIALNAVCYMDV